VSYNILCDYGNISNNTPYEYLYKYFHGWFKLEENFANH
jgi:hypothetical protein